MLARRFESLDGDEGIYDHDADGWTEGMVMWCGGALEAMILADYEAHSGFSSRLLWDLCAGSDWDGHVVLTSRPYGRGADEPVEPMGKAEDGGVIAPGLARPLGRWPHVRVVNGVELEARRRYAGAAPYSGGAVP